MISCNDDSAKSDALAEKSMKELKTVLHEQSQFVKVHAAEYLIWLGHTEEVRKVFLAEDSLHGKETPYRIGIWRVLAQTEEMPEDKMRWINKVLDVYGDSIAPDRLHATETLAKLQQSPFEKYPELTRKTLTADNRNLNTYALWAMSYSSDSAMEKNRTDFLRMALEDSDQIIRKISAFIVRKIRGLTETEWTTLANKAFTEPGTSEMKHSLLNTAFVTLPADIKKTELFDNIYKEMVKDSNAFSAGQRMELALSLADSGEETDLPVLLSMLNNENITGKYEVGSKEGADVRATAAYAILKIKERAKEKKG